LRPIVIVQGFRAAFLLGFVGSCGLNLFGKQRTMHRLIGLFSEPFTAHTVSNRISYPVKCTIELTGSMKPLDFDVMLVTDEG
jgi:hypothetical protein